MPETWLVGIKGPFVGVANFIEDNSRISPWVEATERSEKTGLAEYFRKQAQMYRTRSEREDFAGQIDLYEGKAEVYEGPVRPPDIPSALIPWMVDAASRGQRTVAYSVPASDDELYIRRRGRYDDGGGSATDARVSVMWAGTEVPDQSVFEDFSDRVVAPLVNGADIDRHSIKGIRREYSIPQARAKWLQIQKQIARDIANQASNGALIVVNAGHGVPFMLPEIIQACATRQGKVLRVAAALHGPFRVATQTGAVDLLDPAATLRSDLLRAVGNGAVRWSMPDAESVARFSNAYARRFGESPGRMPLVLPSPKEDSVEAGAAFIHELDARTVIPPALADGSVLDDLNR